MTVTLLCADARALPLKDGSMHCCVTSPPYWGLRDYGTAGQIGLEPTPEAYVANMVAVFREVRRVLRDDGTLWLNLGDCYATGAGKVGDSPGGGVEGPRHRDARRRDHGRPSTNGRGELQARAERSGHPGKHAYRDGVGPITQPNRLPIPGLKPKDLVGIPWRVAFALQADGWWLRSDIVWAKPNPMPESVTDRPTKAHEYLFLLTKSERYHYDAKAIAEPAGGWNGSAFDDGKNVLVHPNVQRRSGNKERQHRINAGGVEGHRANQGFGVPWEGTTRNKRSVWTVATQPYAGAHFAVMPEALAEPCILAGCPNGGGVLDPFAGSGTVGRVALKHGRSAVLCDLNPEYIALQAERTKDVQVDLLTSRGAA